MKALLVLCPVNFRDEEYLVPREKLEASGVEVSVASTQPGTCKGMLGASAEPDLVVYDVNVDDYDAVVVVGGSGSPEYLWNNSRLLEIVKDAYSKGKVVAAICLSSAVLANAGVLKGKKATVYPTDDSVKALRDGGADYLDEDVVVDGKIVTAKGPHAAAEFGEKIIELLKA